MSAVIAGANEAMPNDPEARKRLYRVVLPKFMSEDWDTVNECWYEDDAFDDVVRELYPDFAPDREDALD
jgi:hypothetical protein